jgi:hypothetical protein
MPNVPGLRSIYLKTERLVYFGRMLDKIHLHAAGKLPEDYHHGLGKGFDERCCDFLKVDYNALKERTLAGGTEEEILAWCFEQGVSRTDDECEIWNGFMMKRGWRDALSPRIAQLIKEYGFESKGIESMFDFIEFDEGRDPLASQAWKE